MRKVVWLVRDISSPDYTYTSDLVSSLNCMFSIMTTKYPWDIQFCGYQCVTEDCFHLLKSLLECIVNINIIQVKFVKVKEHSMITHPLSKYSRHSYNLLYVCWKINLECYINLHLCNFVFHHSEEWVRNNFPKRWSHTQQTFQI